MAYSETANVTVAVCPQTGRSLTNSAAAGQFTNTASVSTGSSDSNSGNNSATSIVTAALPAPQIVPAGAVLLFESFSPHNGAIDPGETVTLSLGLKNVGSLNTTNLV